MPVDLDAEPFQFPLERRGLTVVVRPVGDDHAPDVEAIGAEGVDVAQHVVLVGDPEIGADLVAEEILGVDHHHDLHLVGEAGQHHDLVVRGETRQYTGGVHVVDELSPELQIELAPELPSPGFDAFPLESQVFFPVESNFVHCSPFVCDCRSIRETAPGPPSGSGRWAGPCGLGSVEGVDGEADRRLAVGSLVRVDDALGHGLVQGAVIVFDISSCSQHLLMSSTLSNILGI